jgi:hypothetical protein
MMTRLCSGLTIVLILFGWGLSWLRKNDFPIDVASLWSLGFGSVNQYTMAISPNDLRSTSLVQMAIVANLPQIALALVYFSYGSILTILFTAEYWSRFACKAQTVMVSTKIAKQQQTMWALGSPWPYAIFLIVVQVILHWLVSQSLFVVQVFTQQSDGSRFKDPAIINCGYSPIAILFATVVGGFMLLGVLILMFRRFRDGSPPVASTNSVALSAACHPLTFEEDAAYGKLRWGAWDKQVTSISHCSLMPATLFEQGRGRNVVKGGLYA